MHPWEDFSETWAHYIHILDTLETASASALSLGARAFASPLPLDGDRPFASVLADWAPLTVGLNQLNRSMGMRDAYPFAITERVAEKLAFVHDLCRQATSAASARPRLSRHAAPVLRRLQGDVGLARSPPIGFADCTRHSQFCNRGRAAAVRPRGRGRGGRCARRHGMDLAKLTATKRLGETSRE